MSNYYNRARNFARSNPVAAAEAVYNVGNLAYDVFNRFGPRVQAAFAARHPEAAAAAQAAARTNAARYQAARYRRQYNAKLRYRPVRKLRTQKKKKANQVNRLVGKTRTNIYNKYSKRMRRGNKGKLSLQQRLQSGMSLPNTTFAKLHWRGSSMMGFHTCTPGVVPSDATRRFVDTRSFCLNDLSSPPSFAGSPEFQHHVTYSRMWNQLYKEYQVFGAKAKFRLTAPLLPKYLSATKNAVDNSNDSTVPFNAQPGYWYVRAYYTRRSNDTGVPDSVGHPITRGTTALDDKTEEYWGSLREFLTDPTVTYIKDKTNIRSKIHVHSSAKITGQEGDTSSVDFGDKVTSTSYEIETSTKPVTLSVNFSAKKHFEDKNPMTNGPWKDWDNPLAQNDQFNVRLGYIGFDETGSVAYHVPVDRSQSRFVEVDISYFVGFRHPLITPHDEPTLPARLLIGDNDNEIGYEIIDEKDIPEPYEEPPEEMMALLEL